MSTPNKLYLIDGSGFIFRAYHALPPLTNPQGVPVGAVMGYCNMLFKLCQDPDIKNMAVIFDAARRTFRNDIYPDYKAHRPDPPEDLIPQFELIREATTAFNIPWVATEGYEADDLIATYAKMAVAAGEQVVIVSSDKDLTQLVSDDVVMMDPMKQEVRSYDYVEKKFGVTPDKVVDVQALAGDSTDNVPGVPSIGVKTAAQLINEYGDLENLLANTDKIKQPKRRQVLQDHAEDARISKQLVSLKDNVPVTVGLDTFDRRSIDPAQLTTFLTTHGFKGLIARVAQMDGEAAKPTDGGQSVAEDAPDIPAAFQYTYKTVSDKKALQAIIDHIYDVGRVAFDVETTSLSAMKAEIVGLSLCCDDTTAYYVPVAHTEAASQGDLLGDLVGGGEDKRVAGQLHLKDVLELLKPMLEDDSIIKIGHNIKYDWLVMAQAGIDVRPVDDTMLMSYVLTAGLNKHNMDDLAEQYLGHSTIKYTDVTGSGRQKISFAEVAIDKATDYAAEDAAVTWRLYQVLRSQLLQDGMVSVYEYLERPLVRVLGSMEQEGVKVDAEVLRVLSNDFAIRLDALGKDIYETAGEEFNIASPKQLGEVLFEKLKLPGGKKTKTGAYSTDSKTLDNLALEGHDIAILILKWRGLAKLKSTYTDALVEQIDGKTGRVHTNYSMAVTTTGRLSSNDPNLQNIPIRDAEGRKIRTAFVAKDGHKLVSFDYSQIELRLAADVANVPAMQQAFKDGDDIHAITASQVFDVPLAEVSSEVRRQAKAINFGIIYGISAFGLAQNIGVSRSEASDFIKAYLDRYSEIRDYMDNTKEYAREHGYVKTLMGRKCYTPTIHDKNGGLRSFAERAAINAPLQGTAADIIKLAMVKIPGLLKQYNLQSKLLLQVHDELIFEVPDSEVEKLKPIIVDVMSTAHKDFMDLNVPLEIGVGVGANWDEAH